MPPVPSSVRKLPERIATAALVATTDAVDLEGTRHPAPTGEPVRSAAIVRRAPAVVAPLAPARYKVQLTINGETHDKLRRVQDLLRHAVPDGDPAAIFDRALTLLLADIERRKLADVAQPRQPTRARAGSRHVPAAIRRAVWSRDDGQCAFVGAQGRCTERGFLEFHHVIPFARGGPSTAANVQLRCAAHNAYEAAIDFGPFTMRETPLAYQLGPDRGHGYESFNNKTWSVCKCTAHLTVLSSRMKWRAELELFERSLRSWTAAAETRHAALLR